MATYAKSQPRELIPVGTYPARIYSFIHMGTTSYEWGGKLNTTNKFRITFELPTKQKVFKEENGLQPQVLSAEYTLSTGTKSKLSELFTNLYGREMTPEERKGWDAETLVGTPCLVSVVHEESKSGEVYANVGTVSQPIEGMTIPAQINPSFVLNYDDKWNEEAFNKLPDFIKNKMIESLEYRKMKGIASDEEQFAGTPF